MKCISAEYVDELVQGVVGLCTKSIADRLLPLQESPTLASRMEEPDKALQAVQEQRRRFKAKYDAQ